MKLPRRQFLHLAAGAAALPALSRIATAQAFPSRPITMMVPVPAGGAMDTNARVVAEGMRASLGQPVVIENVTGASGTIGAGRVARATPDGYTIVYGANVTHVLNAAVYKLSYDVVADFEPIALIGNTPWLVAARKDFPANDLRGLIAWLKANPDKASSGTAGPGSPSHIGGVLFQNVTGTRFQLIPYKGTAPSIPDLVSGNLDMAILDPITSLPQFRGGRIKIFAAMAKEPNGDGAGHPVRGRSRRARRVRRALAGDVRAERHAEGRDRESSTARLSARSMTRRSASGSPSRAMWLQPART